MSIIFGSSGIIFCDYRVYLIVFERNNKLHKNV